MTTNHQACQYTYEPVRTTSTEDALRVIETAHAYLGGSIFPEVRALHDTVIGCCGKQVPYLYIDDLTGGMDAAQVTQVKSELAQRWPAGFFDGQRLRHWDTPGFRIQMAGDTTPGYPVVKISVQPTTGQTMPRYLRTTNVEQPVVDAIDTLVREHGLAFVDMLPGDREVITDPLLFLGTLADALT